MLVGVPPSGDTPISGYWIPPVNIPDNMKAEQGWSPSVIKTNRSPDGEYIDEDTKDSQSICLGDTSSAVNVNDCGSTAETEEIRATCATSSDCAFAEDGCYLLPANEGKHVAWPPCTVQILKDGNPNDLRWSLTAMINYRYGKDLNQYCTTATYGSKLAMKQQRPCADDPHLGRYEAIFAHGIVTRGVVGLS